MVDPAPYISTADAAVALGVSVSTVKRWVDDGVLPADRTAGGHRKLLRADVLALARSGRLPSGELGAVAATHGDAAELRSAMAEMVRAGQSAELRSLLARAHDNGLSVARLADEIIAPVMREIGQQWHTGHIDVWQEHRATACCLSAVHEFGADLQPRSLAGRPVAIGGGAEGDPYQLPSALAQLVLAENGWHAVNLGANVPFASLARAVDELRPKLVWLSVSHLSDAEGFVERYQGFYRHADAAGAAVAVGGGALVEAVRSQIPYTTFGDRMEHLAALARQLHPRPKPPSRGRPRSRVA